MALEEITPSSVVEDEMEFIEGLRVIWHRRKLILIGTLLAVFMAGIVSLLRPLMYEATAQVRIGRVWHIRIDDPYIVKETIESDAFMARLIQALNLRTTPYKMKSGKVLSIKVVETKEKRPILLEFKGHDSDPRQAVALVDTAARLLIEDHREKFEENLQEYKSYEIQLEKDVSRAKESISEFERLIKGQQMNPAVNPLSAILLQSQLGDKNAHLIKVRKELRSTRINNRSSMATENTQLISPPVLPRDHINLRVTQMMALAALVGLFSAVILAFFLDYLAQNGIPEAKLTD